MRTSLDPYSMPAIEARIEATTKSLLKEVEHDARHTARQEKPKDGDPMNLYLGGYRETIQAEAARVEAELQGEMQFPPGYSDKDMERVLTERLAEERAECQLEHANAVSDMETLRPSEFWWGRIGALCLLTLGAIYLEAQLNELALQAAGSLSQGAAGRVSWIFALIMGFLPHACAALIKEGKEQWRRYALFGIVLVAVASFVYVGLLRQQFAASRLHLVGVGTSAWGYVCISVFVFVSELIGSYLLLPTNKERVSRRAYREAKKKVEVLKRKLEALKEREAALPEEIHALIEKRERIRIYQEKTLERLDNLHKRACHRFISVNASRRQSPLPDAYKQAIPSILSKPARTTLMLRAAIPFFILMEATGCTTSNPEPVTVNVTTIIDQTDSFLTTTVQRDLPEILSMYGGEEGLFNGRHWRMTTFCDHHFPIAKEIRLAAATPSESNELLRRDSVDAFNQCVRTSVDSVLKQIGKLPASLIFGGLAEELNRLARDTVSTRRVLLIYSDGLQHSSLFSAYADSTLDSLSHHQDLFVRSFEQAHPLQDLTGVEVFLMASSKPKSFVNSERVAAFAEFYRALVTRHHGRMTVAGNFINGS